MRKFTILGAAALLIGLTAGCGDDAVDPDTGSVTDTGGTDEGPGEDGSTEPDPEPDVPEPQPDPEPDVPEPQPDPEPDVPTPEPEPDVPEPDAPTPDVPEPDEGPEPDVPPAECPEDADCDDGLACTIDSCTMPNAVCAWALEAGSCLINNVCRAEGEAMPGNPCMVCDPGADPHAWTAASDGTECDDGDACTESACAEGACAAGEAVSCDDGDACTDDSCDADGGCVNALAANGSPCDDGDACTDDSCLDGACEGAAIDCDDANPCTADSCEEGSCVWSPAEGECEDGDACTAGDTCVDGACEAGGPANCDDGNICTEDICDVDFGCYWLPINSDCCIGETSSCDDGDPCTNDLCGDGGGCSYEFNTAACDDGDACTEGDACAEGGCGGDSVSCDDGNPCTEDSCDPNSGCVSTPADGTPCDDGVECTTGDVCTAGVCEGDSSGCVCTPTFSDAVAKLTSILIGDGGYVGEGLDVDEDPSTCAPSTGCDSGIDNNLGLLASLINDSLVGTVEDGSVILVMEVKDLEGASPVAAIYQADLAPSNADCDVQTQSCVYMVDASMVDPDTCEPTVSLAATIEGDQVVAGGDGTVFPFAIPLSGAVLEITIYDVRFEGTLTTSGGQITAVEGVLGGAVPKADLLAAIEAAPDDALPFPKDTVVGLLNSLIENDIDTDGDGTPESASIGIKVIGIGASISGAQ